MKTGTKFTISNYRTGRVLWTLTVVEVTAGAATDYTVKAIREEHPDEPFFFSQKNLDYYREQGMLNIISEPTGREIDATAFKRAKVAILREVTEKGARERKAFGKACAEFEANESIDFRDGVLTFTSRQSGKRRITTRHGCDYQTCECGNGCSYHKFLYELCRVYRQFCATSAVKFGFKRPVREMRDAFYCEGEIDRHYQAA